MRFLLAFVLLLPGLALAQSNPDAAPKYLERVGPYEVRFSAVTTADLPAQVARRYELTRSAQELLINIHVRRMGDEPLGTAVQANIEATVRNLIGQQRRLQLREINEGEAIYYIATMRMSDPSERWIFDLSVTPSDAGQAFTVRFERQFD